MSLTQAQGRQASRTGSTIPRIDWARALLWLSAALAIAGLGVAVYLTVTHATDRPIACSGLGDCDYVNSSEYAEIAGIRVATLGAVAYAMLLALVIGVILRGWRSWLLVAWGLSLSTFAFSIYLTYVELFVIDAICVWCVASACIFMALFATLTAAVLLSPEDPRGGGT